MLGCNLPITELTPDRAKMYLNDWAYGGQRSLNKLHMARMVERAEDGNFPLTMTEIGTVKGEDPKVLDAQHRASTVFTTGITIHVIELVTNWESETAREIRYAEIDHGRGRQLQDIVPASIVTSGIYANRSNVAVIGKATELVRGELRRVAFRKSSTPTMSKSKRIAFAWEWAIEGKLFFDAITGDGALGKEASHLRRRAVVGVLLPLLRTHPTETQRLIERVVRNDGLRPGEAAHKFHSVLWEDYRHGQSVHYARRLAYCAVKHIRGERCHQTKIPEDGVVLPGTGWVVGGE